ncbi:hypothetical protein CALVIDRAFT_602609 [Calocera viscosa TUFC12733]|uniref:Uncharacterized protein n=1 Tax=Calocera viscosa (strain TUFC12733) TaxID=1330018 RepID=A0A167GTH7_CALVF|nr:hypothetical protein CALVIDRAFT_602609 [Calocera viscosa TUFC12733]
MDASTRATERAPACKHEQPRCVSSRGGRISAPWSWPLALRVALALMDPTTLAAISLGTLVIFGWRSLVLKRRRLERRRLSLSNHGMHEAAKHDTTEAGTVTVSWPANLSGGLDSGNRLLVCITNGNQKMSYDSNHRLRKWTSDSVPTGLGGMFDRVILSCQASDPFGETIEVSCRANGKLVRSVPLKQDEGLSFALSNSSDTTSEDPHFPAWTCLHPQGRTLLGDETVSGPRLSVQWSWSFSDATGGALLSPLAPQHHIPPVCTSKIPVGTCHMHSSIIRPVPV